MVRPTIGNMLVVGLMAVVFIWAGKALTRAFPVKGLSDVFAGI
jgi:hypothetical protein